LREYDFGWNRCPSRDKFGVTDMQNDKMGDVSGLLLGLMLVGAGVRKRVCVSGHEQSPFWLT
jgi:hypothetical protein